MKVKLKCLLAFLVGLALTGSVWAEWVQNNDSTRFTSADGVLVDSRLEVTAPNGPASFDPTVGTGSQIDPAVVSTDPTTTLIGTQLDTITGTETDGQNGGVLLESNGNATLSRGSGTETIIEVIKATTFEVYNADQPLAGQPVPGTQRYVAGYKDEDDRFEVLSPDFDNQADLDAWILGTSLDDPIYDPVRITRTLDEAGGNLQVGGNANVDGVLSLGAGANWAAVANVAESINNNSAAIARNSSRIDKNSRGIAMTAALVQTTVLPGMDNALDVSVAVFDGETGLALTYSRRINENVQLNFGAATTTDLDESVLRAGIGVQW